MRYTSPVCKIGGSPKVVFNSEYHNLIDQVDVLDEQLDALRKTQQSWFGNVPPMGYDHIRQLRKEISSLMARVREIFETLNPEYVKYWGITTK